MRRTCIICDKEFETKNVQKIYCSDKCAKYSIRVRNWLKFKGLENNVTKETLEIYRKSKMATCRICGKDFIKSTGCQVTCSKKCSKINSNTTKVMVREKVKAETKELKKVMAPNRKFQLDPNGNYYAWVTDGKRGVIHKLSETTLSDIQFAHFIETKEIVRLREIND